jgi:hypothetical protein
MAMKNGLVEFPTILPLEHAYLSIEEQQIKCKDADLDLDIFGLDILPLARHQLLEWENLLVDSVPSNSLTIQNETIDILLNPAVKPTKHIWVLL